MFLYRTSELVQMSQRISLETILHHNHIKLPTNYETNTSSLEDQRKDGLSIKSSSAKASQCINSFSASYLFLIFSFENISSANFPERAFISGCLLNTFWETEFTGNWVFIHFATDVVYSVKLVKNWVLLMIKRFIKLSTHFNATALKIWVHVLVKDM